MIKLILNAKVWMEKCRSNEDLIQHIDIPHKALIMWIKQLTTYSEIRSFRRFTCVCSQVLFAQAEIAADTVVLCYQGDIWVSSA